MIIQKLINVFHRIIEIHNRIMYNMHMIFFISKITGVYQRIGDEKMGTMKGTITRRLDNSLNTLQNEFGELICDRDFKRSLQALKQASRSERPTRLRNLYLQFDKCKIEYERGRDNNYYEHLISNSSNIPSPEQLEERMLLALYDRFEDYPTPEEYMKRMVDRLCEKEDGWQEDTLRLRILKQFIKYGNYLEDAGFRGRAAIQKYVGRRTNKKVQENDVLTDLDDGVFDVLGGASKAQRRPNGTYGLLKAADDLASGKFRMGGATKRLLYLFAMVFDMTYYTGSEIERFNYATDIETNLFRKYYTNNLMRFITDSYSGNLSEFENDPSGQGINYKNFAEMVYLYYISKPLEPQKKIKASADMINEIVIRSQKREDINKSDDDDTFAYRYLFSEDILNLPEEKFRRYLILNYRCLPEEGMDSVVPIHFQTGQSSAFRIYQSLKTELVGLLHKKGITIEDCNYGLWFTDASYLRRKGLDRLITDYPGIDHSKFAKLIELLLAVNSFVGSSSNRSQPKALHVTSCENVTRTSLLVVYYYLYNLKHESDKGMIGKSFEELFNDFKSDINELLEKSFYQPISSNNIFDIILIFSSYSYLNM